MKWFLRLLVGRDVRLNRLLAFIETKVPTTMESKVLTAVAWSGAVAIAVIVFDSRNVFSLLGGVVKSVPYVVTWREFRDWGDRAKLPLYLAVGLVAYFLLDAYVSFHAIRDVQSSTASIAAILVMATSLVIVPAGALITFVLVRILEGAFKWFRR